MLFIGDKKEKRENQKLVLPPLPLSCHESNLRRCFIFYPEEEQSL
jgi:hypothetical protein